MTYEELLISIDLKGYENVLPFIGRICLGNKYLFVVCDDGDCHLFDITGKEDDISKIKEIYEDVISKDIKKIVIPNGVTRIGYSAFFDCCKLSSVTIPNSVTSIGSWAFASCGKLINMKIPINVTSIGNWAFMDCNNLKSLIFKNKTFKQVKSMENYPFGIEDESIIKCN